MSEITSEEYTILHEKYTKLVSQIFDLEQKCKRLESYYEKYCILQENNDGFMHELEDTKEQLSRYKSVVEKIQNPNEFEKMCESCEFSTLSGTDTEKLRKLLLAEPEDSK